MDSPFSPAHRALTAGVLMMVTVTAFQALGVATVLPGVARDLGGLGAYGWAFSALMLASVAGMVGAGEAADRGAAVPAFLAGVLTFGAGSALAAAAGSWTVLLGGRALQGVGLGSLGSLVYVAVALAYPPALYGRMMALLSSAWVLPALLGPVAGGFVADRAGWRWVFLMLLPLVPVAAALALPGLRGLPPRTRDSGGRGALRHTIALVAGMGALLLALGTSSPAATALLAAGGAALAGPAFARLLPAGTLRVRRGLPAGVAARGLLAVGYLGCDAFLPLGLTQIHGATLSQAGLVISAGSLSWSAGSLTQGRLDRRDGGAGRAGRVRLGAGILGLGLLLTAPAVLTASAPIATVAAGWAVGGLGIGMAYPSVGAVSLAQAPEGEEGRVSAALQIVETICVALFTGVGGALIAAGLHRGWSAATAIALIFAAAAGAVAGAVLTGLRVARPRPATG